jgi:hypothetical protein
MTTESVREILRKLTVGKGGKGSCKRINADLEVCMREHNAGDVRGYALALRFRNRNAAVRTLPKDSVYSKSPGMWARDRVWRLTPAAVDFYAKNIAEVMRYAPR